MSKNVIVLTSSNPLNNDNAYYASITAKQIENWKAEGIGDRYLDGLEKAYMSQLKTGCSPKLALRRILMEVEDARGESLFDQYVPRLSMKFHISTDVATALIEEARRHHHKNRRPTFQQAISPIYAKVKNASLRAYQSRRARQSVLAQKLIESGVV